MDKPPFIQVLRSQSVKGQEKLSSMAEASKRVPTLTREQASQIIDAAQLPPKVFIHKEMIIDLMIETHEVATPGKDKLPFEYLLKSASHPCSLEFTKSKRFEEEVDATVKQFPPGESEQNTFFLRTKLAAMAYILSNGYQEQFREHWTLDSQGNITGLKPEHVPRQPKCDAYVRQNKEKWRPSAVDVGYGGKKKKRTLKKKTKKPKKTLRRK
jgi:hypothetical protein